MTTLLLPLLLLMTLSYPVGAMNARGERILIFGDSLTQHASGNNPIWNVDQGPQRQHHGPGDLLASLLLDQGAAAVRTNALVSRSAFNFWTRELGSSLVAGDLAWRPTKIIFVLGTNDIGLAQAADYAAFVKLRDAYKPSGAEMWAIGPFNSAKPPAAIEQVAQTMQRVFGPRFIDGRKLSLMISPGPDGIHYTPQGARLLALNMADALLSTRSMRPWVGMAIGAGIAVGAGLVYSLWWSKGRGLAGLEIVDGKRWGGTPNELIRAGYRQVPCKSGLDRNGQARCWSRGLAGGGDGDDPQPGEDDEAWWQRIQSKARRGQEQVQSKLAEHEALILIIRGGRRILVIKSPEMSHPEEGPLRITTFDEDGPIGHMTRRSIEALAEDVYRDWHPTSIQPATEAEVMEWTATERFARGAEAVVEVQRRNSGLRGHTLPPGATFIVERAAQAVPARERFGASGRKVFIVDVHKALAQQGVRISLADFKRELVRMHQEGNVVLARAD